MIMARSRICQGRVKDAVDILKKAKLVVTKYIDEITTKNGKSNVLVKASLKSLTVQAKEIRRLLAECAEKKKAHKKMVSHEYAQATTVVREDNRPVLHRRRNEQWRCSQ